MEDDQQVSHTRYTRLRTSVTRRGRSDSIVSISAVGSGVAVKAAIEVVMFSVASMILGADAWGEKLCVRAFVGILHWRERVTA